MMYALTRIILVILAGVYAMRSTTVLFHPSTFNPMSLVAVFAFVMSFVIFQKMPTGPGLWAYSLIGFSLMGVFANSMLYFRPDALHAGTTNMTFSAVSIVGWAIVAIYAGMASLGMVGKAIQG
jgi:hypothetical protein